MKNIKFLIGAVLVGLLLPVSSTLAVYNAVSWPDTTRLYLTQVAPTTGAQKGITIKIYADSFLEYYYLDTNSLRLQMRSGSKVYLESPDRKLFNVVEGYPATECSDSYSRFTYESNSPALVDFTITFTDGGNCPVAEPVEEPVALPATEQIDVTNLEKITTNGLTKALGQKSKTHFVYDTIVETVEVLSVGSAQAKIKLSSPNKELDLEEGSEKLVDTDADGWHDLSLTLKNTNSGQAELLMKAIEPVKVTGVNPGDLVKVSGGTTIYYVGADSKLYVFPNEKVYYTWYSDFNAVKTISSTDLGKFGWGGLVTYRPGARMVKFTINTDVYVVERNGVLRKLAGESMAKELYGAEWNKKIDDINEAFMFSYTFGSPLVNMNDYNQGEASQMTPTVGVDRGI